MTLLGSRFPRLASLPHVPLVTETPVLRLDQASHETGADLWVKCDDRTAEPYGGNKVRKLERLIGDARRRSCDVLITTGAFGSHHTLATSIFGRKWGFDVHGFLVPQPITHHVEENLRADLAVGAQIHPVRRPALVPARVAAFTASLRLQGRRPYLIPHGGSSPLGAVGFVEAGLELAGQIEAGEMPEPSSIHVALGSAGTCVGLAVGLAAAGLSLPIVAVRVTPLLVCNQRTVSSLLRRTVELLRRHDRSFPDVARGAARMIRIDGSQYGAGYGRGTEAASDAIARARVDDLELDATYTAKAFAAFLRDSRGSRDTRLFWHTLSSADLSELLREAPPLPSWARSRAG